MNTALGYLGNIPDGWNLVHLGRLTSEVRTLNSDCLETNALQFKMGSIISKSNGDSKYHPETLEGYTVVAPGDVVVNGLNLNYDLKSLRVGQVRENGVITSAYIIVRPEKIDADYFKYLLKGFDSIKTFHGMGKGIRLTLGYEELRRMYIPVPSPAEQSRIATFLDERCAKIDEAIARHDALIKKLDDYRKAVITEAVTKGVRGKRGMKESGVVWIKEIPSDWTYKPLKAIFTFGKGLSITKANLVEKGFPVISYGQVHAKYNSGVSVCDELIRYVSKDDICESSLVKKNDLIFADTSEDLEGCGNCVYIDTDYPIYGGYHTIVLNSRSEQSNKFIAYLVKTDDWRFQLRRQLTEVKLYSVSQKVLKNTTVILPTPAEQQEIVAYLDEKCAAIDAAKEHHAQLMAKLEEYKKSLIYYAVTGKIEC